MPKLKPLIIPQEQPRLYHSSGVKAKPPECQFCPNNKSTGFVPDWLPADPKMLFLFAAPEKNDPVDGHPWAGAYGYWKENHLLKPAGLTRYDIAIAHVTRCYPGTDKFGKLAYPAKSIRNKAEVLCRVYDKYTWKSGEKVNKGIISFVPDTFIITFDISDLRNGAAFLHLFKKDIRKALELNKNGAKPCVLFGAIPTALFAPYAIAPGSGGIKSWRGHIFSGQWKDLIPGRDIESENPFKIYDENKKNNKEKTAKLSSGKTSFSQGSKGNFKKRDSV